MIDFLTFRSNALTNLTLMKKKPRFNSIEDREAWIKSEYDRQVNESVWNDPDYLKQLEQRAEVDEVINRYEKGLG